MKGIKYFDSMHVKKRSPVKYLIPRNIKRIIFTIFVITIFSQIILADDKIVVENLLKERIDNIIATLKNKDLDDKSKEGKIEDVIKPIINFKLMSMLALGKESWTSLTAEDQKRFVELFANTIEQTLISKILSYADESIVIEGSDQVNNKKVDVSTFIIDKEKKIAVLYKFYQSGSGWEIYDVEIEGVSILKNFKSQFTDNLQEMTAKELMIKMEKSDSSR